MNLKQAITFLITAGFILIVAGGASAGVLDSISDFFEKSFKTSTSTIVETKPDTPLYKPALDYENAVIKAVEEANPSVVSIVITKNLPVIKQCRRDPTALLPPEFREFFGGGFEILEPCEAGTETREIGGGSGFIVSADGLVVTNKHVVLDEKANYTVLTNNSGEYEAKVLARDPVQDIAILKIEAQGLTPARLGDSDSIQLGQTAIAIGNALGEFRNTVSVGVISGLARNITARGGGLVEFIEGVIQTDAAINQGNSGGPLLNLKGEVIGVNTAIAQGAQNIGFAIPINRVKRDIVSVMESGEIKIPFLGVRYITTKDGAIIRGGPEGPAVFPDSPAFNAGLRAEDVILEINGEKLSLEKSLGFVIQKYNIGDVITLKIKRGEEILEFQALLDERP